MRNLRKPTVKRVTAKRGQGNLALAIAMILFAALALTLLTRDNAQSAPCLPPIVSAGSADRANITLHRLAKRWIESRTDTPKEVFLAWRPRRFVPGEVQFEFDFLMPTGDRYLYHIVLRQLCRGRPWLVADAETLPLP